MANTFHKTAARIGATAGTVADTVAATAGGVADAIQTRANALAGAARGGTKRSATKAKRLIPSAKAIDARTDRLVAKARRALPERLGGTSPVVFVPASGTARALTVGGIALGVGAIAAGAFALYYLKERSPEEAENDVIDDDGDFELRRYAALIVAETRTHGDRTQALDRAFRPLADYIGAKPGGRAGGGEAGGAEAGGAENNGAKAGNADESGEKIAMTVPVIAEEANEGQWRVRFVMPAEYSRDALPAPAGGVSIAEVPARHIAALRFSGRGTDEALVAEKRAELLRRVAEHGLTPRGKVEYAFYNAPIIPGFLRRNEVWIEVEPASALTGRRSGAADALGGEAEMDAQMDGAEMDGAEMDGAEMDGAADAGAAAARSH